MSPPEDDKEFKDHHASVAYIKNWTSLPFNQIAEWDTFIIDPASPNEVKIVTEDDLRKHIKKQAE